jgi:hypothetical protein
MRKMPSGYVQQSPWLSVSNKQMELMGHYMAELGITLASRSRVACLAPATEDKPIVIKFAWQGDDCRYRDDDGNAVE